MKCPKPWNPLDVRTYSRNIDHGPCESTKIWPLNPSTMDGKMQHSGGYAQLEEDIGSQEVGVRWKRLLMMHYNACVQVGSNTRHYFVDVGEEENHTRGTPQEEIHDNPNFEEAPLHHEFVEKTNICQVPHIAKLLTLPLIPAPTTRRRRICTPITDYSTSWIMTNNEYLAQWSKRPN